MDTGNLPARSAHYTHQAFRIERKDRQRLFFQLLAAELPEKVYKNAVVYSAGCTRHYPGACGVSLLCDHPRVRSLHFGGYSGTGNLQL